VSTCGYGFGKISSNLRPRGRTLTLPFRRYLPTQLTFPSGLGVYLLSTSLPWSITHLADLLCWTQSKICYFAVSDLFLSHFGTHTRSSREARHVKKTSNLKRDANSSNKQDKHMRELEGGRLLFRFDSRYHGFTVHIPQRATQTPSRNLFQNHKPKYPGNRDSTLFNNKCHNVLVEVGNQAETPRQVQAMRDASRLQICTITDRTHDQNHLRRH
jgi:hypothetical protein